MGKRRLAKRVALVLLVLVAACLVGGGWYLSDYYHADARARAAMADEDGAADGVTVEELSDKLVAFEPADPVAGLVFYPGAKVEPAAYAPLLTQCAEHGILCVLVRPLGNLAILDVNAPEGVLAQFPQINEWMIGGHSMGGVAACSYAAQHQGEFADLALLASYPADDLTGFDGEVLSTYGSLDGVLNRENYEAAKAKLPAAEQELVIEGGNHGHFGDYGEQEGDGEATISREDQQRQTVDEIVALVD